MDEYSVFEIQGLFSTGELTAVDLVQAYLDRIESNDRQGPGLNAIITINPEALDIAAALDKERQESGPRGPLHGVPVILKDNIDTADQMPTTAGSLALKDSIALQDAFIVRKLRKAGAIILAKANLSEWANFRSSKSTSGWSAVGGQVRNPYALDRTPCGSSSGSAVAVAANYTPLAVGTETDGSIICPSAVNSIVGIKPTIGLVSRCGVVPVALSQDTAGPMARTVADAALLLGILAGEDSADLATAEAGNLGKSDYTRFLDAEGLDGARIGISRNYFGQHPEVDALMEAAIHLMEKKGATIIDPVNIELSDESRAAELEMFLFEFKADLDTYLSGLNPKVPVRSMRDVINFNKRHRDDEMPYFGQERMLQAVEKRSLNDPDYLLSKETANRLAGPEGIDAVMAEYELDALMAPPTCIPWLIDLVNGDHCDVGGYSVAAVAGYPSITVPAGYVFGLPVGICFFAGAYQEPTLIKIAYAYERASRNRVPPRYLPTADLSL